MLKDEDVNPDEESDVHYVSVNNYVHNNAYTANFVIMHLRT